MIQGSLFTPPEMPVVETVYKSGLCWRLNCAGRADRGQCVIFPATFVASEGGGFWIRDLHCTQCRAKGYRGVEAPGA